MKDRQQICKGKVIKKMEDRHMIARSQMRGSREIQGSKRIMIHGWLTDTEQLEDGKQIYKRQTNDR